jgi:CDP-6-deoxy-D-xylo-4-hexulose-3-dehydrase
VDPVSIRRGRRQFQIAWTFRELLDPPTEKEYAELRKRNHGIIGRELEHIKDLVRTADKLPGSDPSWFGYPIIIGTRNRREIIKRIEARGVASRLLFGGNMARQRFIRESLHPVNLEKE